MSKLRSDELVNMEGDGSPNFPQGATSIEPTANNQVATKSYVDSAISAGLGNVVSSTAPTNPIFAHLLKVLLPNNIYFSLFFQTECSPIINLRLFSFK